MELVRFVFRALLIAILTGLLVEWFVPAGGQIVDVATAVFAAATWVVPLGIVARWHIRPPRTSLGSVGLSISLIASALTLSLITITLALLDFVFASGGDWAWRSLLAVAAFWIAGPIALYLSAKFEKPMKRDAER
jgi:multisubunit Na+/H+ antiporter MnhG subunit